MLSVVAPSPVYRDFSPSRVQGASQVAEVQLVTEPDGKDGLKGWEYTILMIILPWQASLALPKAEISSRPSLQLSAHAFSTANRPGSKLEIMTQKMRTGCAPQIGVLGSFCGALTSHLGSSWESGISWPSGWTGGSSESRPALQLKLTRDPDVLKSYKQASRDCHLHVHMRIIVASACVLLAAALLLSAANRASACFMLPCRGVIGKGFLGLGDAYCASFTQLRSSLNAGLMETRSRTPVVQSKKLGLPAYDSTSLQPTRTVSCMEVDRFAAFCLIEFRLARCAD
ncbi:uncharacterized protein BCR38DRAFT_111281 [Pseudomassariella vexata]|uniref:Uncharacterized protein n=1 Tax=Pseudomassariella vexata TaxID=1141098 RepID=A0A1Y2DDE3_9PEZI|nr:uncharacterized protein BCR38DRAFT_111281 [Pseudomassariella vexata]ORY57303.1 hypothetical protein BCR38DRAFT_111281 [Pseudomassariella vexata]